jgi:hypothetical protein
MTSYIRSIGWNKGQYITAIGIRSDEIDRVDENFQQKLYWYPLIDLEMTKEKIILWWKNQEFDLTVPEHLGNCTWCWKKSLRKHLTLAKNHSEIFDVPEYFEENYKNHGAGSGDRRFFRKRMEVKDIKEMSKLPFNEFEDIDKSDGCSESCEAYL